MLDHYYLAIGPQLTNLGILCVGRREDRARLGTAPVIQFIKYDEVGRKVNKLLWDNHSLSPMELIEAVWQGIPDFRESYELPDGLFRQHIPVYDDRVVRELLVNALVHRPYTQRGDIYLNLHPDRLEVVNPGLLPLGVTPRNILHQSVRRNQELARVSEDLMRYPGSSIGDIHARIGTEIIRRKVKGALDRLRDSGQVRAEGEKRGRKYWLSEEEISTEPASKKEDAVISGGDK